MKNIIVPLNAFPRNQVLEKGQQNYIKSIANAGAFGVEIRRELFKEDEPLPLVDIAQKIREYQLFGVYSAPVEIWRLDGSLNLEGLKQILGEALQMGASWVKVSLGYYQKAHSDLQELERLLYPFQSELQLLVENDQTRQGGNIERMNWFFEGVREKDIPLKMTFDIGNWVYTGEDVMKAVQTLFENVLYLHLKHVERLQEQWVTLPLPVGGAAVWNTILDFFPSKMIKALEFPIEPIEKMNEYIQIVSETAFKKVSE